MSRAITDVVSLVTVPKSNSTYPGLPINFACLVMRDYFPKGEQYEQ
jgi:hypothetical protein